VIAWDERDVVAAKVALFEEARERLELGGRARSVRFAREEKMLGRRPRGAWAIAARALSKRPSASRRRPRLTKRAAEAWTLRRLEQVHVGEVARFA